MRHLTSFITTAFLFVVLTPAGAQESSDVELDIAEQPLSSSLREVADSFDLTIAFYSESTDGLEAPALDGDFTSEAALDTLLADTNLEYTFINESSVAVRPTADERGASDSKNLETVAPILMAQNQTTQQTQTTSSRSSEGGSQSAEQSDREQDERGLIETIVVYGSRNAGIRRHEDDVQPYVVFDQAQIRNSHAVNIEDFLRTRLPMNTASASFSQQPTTTFGNQSEINLRGLGANQTLILINGRRQASVSAGENFSQPDLNGIPMSAIERIEVLPTTAAGIYGGGATGGAVNVILKRNFSGYELAAGYGSSFDDDASRYNFEGAAGFSFNSGRSSLMLTGSYSESDPLLVGDRDFWTRGRSLFVANDPDSFFSTPRLGYTTNIRSADGSNLVLDDGTQLGSPITSVPEGYAGPASDGGAAFIANAGSFNLDLPQDTSGSLRSLLNNPTTSSFSISARHEVADWVELIFDGTYFENQGSAVGGLLVNSATIDADAPNNPFTTAIQVSFPSPNVLFPRESASESSRVTAGAVFQLPKGWGLQLELGRGESTLESFFFNQGNVSQIVSGVADGTLNVMRDVNAFPVDYSAALPEGFSRQQNGPTDSVLKDVSMRFSGRSIELPAGPIRLSAIFERRNEEIRESLVDTQLSGQSVVQYLPELEQEVDSAYIEAIVPIVSRSNARFGVRELELQLAVRHDEYETNAPADLQPFIQLSSRDEDPPSLEYTSSEVSSTDFTVGLSYSPSEDVQLRGSFSTGFLPPSVSQVSSGIVVFPAFFNNFISDPRRGGVPGTNSLPIEVIVGGGTGLEPEQSESMSLGLILTPRVIPGLRASIDYVKIEKSDELAQLLSFFNMLEFEDTFPSRVVRAELTPEDQALGYTGGEVLSFDTSIVNISETSIEAYDFQLSYLWEFQQGRRLDLYAVATRHTSLENRLLPNDPLQDGAGFSGGPLEWRGNMGADYHNGALTLGWNAQYYDSYRAYSVFQSEASAEQTVLQQGSEYIPSQIYHDVFATYRFDEHSRSSSNLFSGLDLRVGIQNVFDERPPTIATTSASRGYSLFGDPRLRRFTIDIRKKFD